MASLSTLEKKLEEATTLNNAVNILLKWYDGNNIVFFRKFVEKLPSYISAYKIPSGGAEGHVLTKKSVIDGDMQWQDLSNLNASVYLLKSTYDPAEKAEQVLTVSDATNFATASQGALAETAVQPTSTDTLTNKTIIDYTNHIHADAVHHRIKCIDPTGVTPGTAVAFVGWNSGEEAIEVVRANNTTSIAIGIVLETLANGEFGLMVMSGTVNGIDTTTFPKGAGVAQQGDILYVNGNGQLTGDEPTTGFAQPIALLLRFQSNTGALQVLAAYPKQDASDVRFTPSGDISSTNVQTSLEELDNDKAPRVHTHDAAEVVSGVFDNDRISQSSVTQHQAALSITESQISDLSHDADLIKGVSIDATVATPSDGDILVYRTAGSDWVLEPKPAGGSNPALNDVTDVTISTPADNDVLAYDTTTGDWINQTASEAGLATSAQGALADSALQPTDIDTLAELNALLTDATLIDTNDSRLSDARTPLAHTHTHADITDYDTELAGKTNTNAFTPTADYHPATKKYVDDAIVSGGGYTDAQAQDAVGGMLNASEFTYTDAPPGVSINQIAASKITGTKTAAFISDFDTEVSNNTDVAANTSARHDAVTVTDSTEIDFTLTGQNITASLKAGSIDESKLDASVNASLDKADSAIQSGDLATVATTGSYTDLIDKPTIPTRLSELSDVDASVSSPSDGDILVFRNVGNDWILEAKPEGGSNPALSDITDVTLSGVADNEVLAYDSLSGDWINQTASEAGLATAAQGALADSALQPSAIGVSVQAHSAILDATTASFTTADETKLNGIEAGADVTDATNVAAAGAIMDGDFTANGIMKRTGAGTYATAVEDTDYQGVLAEGAFVDGDKTKLDGIAAGADVTDFTNVQAAGALMDSEVTNLAAVKAFDPTDYATAAQGVLAEKCEIGVACSDETTDLTTGTAKVTFRMPYAMTLTGVRANVNTAPVGSTITVDINEGGVSVLSTLLTIDAAEKTSTTAAVPAVISDSGLADDAEITIDIDQVGSTTAGKGLKVWLIGTRA